MAINKIMVLGAGTMGMGIAQVFAEAGKTVIVVTHDQATAAYARRQILVHDGRIAKS